MGWPDMLKTVKVEWNIQMDHFHLSFFLFDIFHGLLLSTNMFQVILPLNTRTVYMIHRSEYANW